MEYKEIQEFDESGRNIGTFVYSFSSNSKHEYRVGRLDLLPSSDAKPWAQQLLDVFLPVGYPRSVTDDYMPLAFSSSIAGMLASRAVLEGVGVGDSSASPTAALLLTVIQASIGRVATILFAHRFGKALEPECKMYRLLADYLNDTAIILDCLSTAFPRPTRVLILSLAGALRALCGVAAGSAKASLSAHFAKWGNLGELNAVCAFLDNGLDIAVNSNAELGDQLHSTQVQGASTVKRSQLHGNTILEDVADSVVLERLEPGDCDLPAGNAGQVATCERIFERDGVLRWYKDPIGSVRSETILGRCTIGSSLQALHRCITASKTPEDCESRPDSKMASIKSIELGNVIHIYEEEPYILWTDARHRQICIVLKRGCTPEQQLRAWTEALLAAKITFGDAESLVPPILQAVQESIRSAESAFMLRPKNPSLLRAQVVMQQTKIYFPHISKLLKDAGWDLEAAVLETGTSYRIEV